MLAKINGVDYFVGWQHEEVSPKTKKPTEHELVGALVLASLQLAGNTLPEPSSGTPMDVSVLVNETLDRYTNSLLPFSHTTTCYIKTSAKRDGELVSSGFAQCDKQDQFEYATGRLISFLKAVSAFPASDHEEWFDAFDRAGITFPVSLKLFLDLAEGKPWEALAYQFFRLEPVSFHAGLDAA